MPGVTTLARQIQSGDWIDDGDGADPIPESWTDVRHAPDVAGQRRYYAVLARVGEYRTIVQCERAVRVLYVRGDGERAFDRRYAAVDRGSGTIPDPETFHSTLVMPPRYGGAVDGEERERFRALLGELYGAAPDAGGESDGS